MESEIFEKFLTKMCEVEKMYQTFKKEDQEISLKVLVSLCKRFEMVLGPSYSMTTYMLYTTQGIEDYFIQVTSSVMKNVPDIEEEFPTAVDYSKPQVKKGDYPASRLRERKPQIKQPVHDDQGLGGSDAFSPSEDMDDYESVLSKKRKRKQPCPRQTISEPPDASGKDSNLGDISDTMEGEDSLPLDKSSSSDTVKPDIRKLLAPHLRPNMYHTIGKRKRGRPPKRIIFICEKCPETFSTNETLMSHCIEVHKDAPRCCRLCRNEFLNEVEEGHRCVKKYPSSTSKYNTSPKICRVCDKEFQKLIQLKRHMQKEHARRKKALSFFCRFCGKGFMKQLSLFSHYKEHAGGQYVCMKCGQFSSDFESYKSHVHLPLELRAYPCPICHKVFAKPDMLKSHLSLHPGEKLEECTTCQLFFKTTKELAQHKRSQHGFRARDGPKEKRFICQECGKALLSKHALERHMRYHTGEKPHVCEHCGLKFREINNMKRHMTLHFDGHRNFVCEICGAAFHAKKTLETHHAYKHSEERKFQCPECPLAFKAKNALGRHSKVHSTEKNHKCWCGSAFKLMYKLRQHLRSVHGTDEMLPPVRRVSNLDPSKPQSEGKTDGKEKTDSAGTLIKDAMMTSGSMVPLLNPMQSLQPANEQSFQCPTCPMTFKTKNGLRKHGKVHSTKEEHKCWCGTSFKHMYSLRQHLLSFHGSDEMLPPDDRAGALDGSKKSVMPKTGPNDKADHHDMMMQDSMVASGSMVPRPNPMQSLQPMYGNQQHRQTPTGTPVSGAADNTGHFPPHGQDPNDGLHYSTLLPVSLSSSSLPTSMAEHHMALSKQSQPVAMDTQASAMSSQVPTLETQHMSVPQQQQQQQQSHPHHHDAQSQMSNDQAQRLRYGPDPNSMYSNNSDPRDPYMQANTSLGNSNIIPQAVAYSNIMREYGNQFPFLQDGTLYPHGRLTLCPNQPRSSFTRPGPSINNRDPGPNSNRN